MSFWNHLNLINVIPGGNSQCSDFKKRPCDPQGVKHPRETEGNVTETEKAKMVGDGVNLVRVQCLSHPILQYGIIGLKAGAQTEP